MIENIRAQLLAEADGGYKEFSKKINPDANNIIGIRVPFLRKLAKEIVNSDWRNYVLELESKLEQEEELYFEEKMLWGLVIGNAAMEPEVRIDHIRSFLPAIDNWATCDICQGDLKFARKEPGRTMMWEFLQPYFISKNQFDVRFAVTMAMSHYLTEDYFDRVLTLYAAVSHEGYYAKMAVAWAISQSYVKFPGRTWTLLTENRLKDKWTHNKAIQKIAESYRVGSSDKDYLKKLKR